MAKKLSVSDLRRMIAEEVRRAALLKEGHTFAHSTPEDDTHKMGSVQGYMEDGHELVKIDFGGGQEVVMFASDVAEFVVALQAAADEAMGVDERGESTELSKFSAPMPGEY